MHDCPNCGQACYCDIDDCPMPTPDDCRHECQEQMDEFDEWNDCGVEQSAAADEKREAEATLLSHVAARIRRLLCAVLGHRWRHVWWYPYFGCHWFKATTQSLRIDCRECKRCGRHERKLGQTWLPAGKDFGWTDG